MRKVKSACWNKGNFLKCNECLSNGKAISCVNGVLLLGSLVCVGGSLNFFLKVYSINRPTSKLHCRQWWYGIMGC